MVLRAMLNGVLIRPDQFGQDRPVPVFRCFRDSALNQMSNAKIRP
jgi:hypothetical protein